MTGFGSVLRLTLKRNWVFYLCWVVALASLLPLTVTKYHDLVPDGSAGTLALDQLAANPTMRALLGPAFDLTNAGGFTFFRVGTFTAAAAAMMAAFGVIRATRAEEEEGRVELVRSGAVSRHVPLAVAVTLSLAACLVAGVGTALGMSASTSPAAGAWASGLGITLTGTMFTGIAAICAQVFTSARTARVWSVGFLLGGLYLLRAAVDGYGSGTSSLAETLRWFMPLEWAALVRPYASERWWVLLLPLVVTVATIWVAFWLESVRDHGAGLRAASPGRAEAVPSMSGPVGLSWRLQRVSVISWVVAVVVSDVGMGSLSTSLDSIFQGNDQVAELLRKMSGGTEEIRAAFFVTMLGIMATVISIAGVMILSRLGTEEPAGRAEVVLATATSRWRYALATFVPALALPVVLLVATGVLLPVGQAVSDGSASVLSTYTQAALALLPGVVLVVGLGMLLIGCAPRLYGLVWVVLGWGMLASWVMPLFNVPDWLLRLHPWGFLPHLPTDPMRWGAFTVELVVGAAFCVIGLVAYRRRDIAGR